MIKILLKHLLLFIFLFIIGTSYFLLFSAPGLQLGLSLAAMHSPVKIQLRSLTGTIFSGFSLHDVTVQLPNQSIKIQNITFSWNPTLLFSKKLEAILLFKNVEYIDSKNIHIPVAEISVRQHNLQTQLSSNLLQGKLQGTFEAKNMSFSSWKLAINANSLHPEVIWKNIPGELNFYIQAEKIDHTITLHIPQLFGKLRQYPLLAMADIAIDEKNIAVKNFIIHLADTSLHFTGSVNDSWNLQWQLNCPQLTAIIPNISGKFDSKGSITGQRLQPILSTSLNIQNVTIPHQFELKRTQLTGTVKINQTQLDPTFQANAFLSHGEITLPSLELTLIPHQLEVHSDLQHKINLTGKVQSGAGTAELQGVVDLTTPTFDSNLSLQGSNITVANLPHYKIIASPDLTLHYTHAALTIDGTLLIPQAEITPASFSDSISLPDEVIFVDQPQVKTTSLLSAFSLNLALILGDKVHLRYEDLDAQLAGKIHITQTPTTPTIATGELYAKNGTYHAYGKTLQLQQGKIIYAGNTIDNPGLAIRAIQEIKTTTVSGNQPDFSTTPHLQAIATGNETIVVGVQIQGTANNPIVSLYSNQAITQNDILSYLLFGYPQSQGSNVGQLAALFNATSSVKFGNKSSSLLNATQNLQKSLGLSEFTVGSTDVFDPARGTVEATTSFMIGKQLADRLYLHYSIGLFNPISIFNLRYQLTKRLSLQSETSSLDNGADLFYTFEK